jgi:16S rRNA (cytosine1402-N4)-methyltransferase
LEYSITHKTVLAREVVNLLALRPEGTYLDVTFGSGGHTRALFNADPSINIIAFDWDKVSLEQYGEAMAAEFPEHFRYIWGNFAHLYKLLKKEKIAKVDGIIADFGTSQMQIHGKDGFSFLSDTPLDMRMSPGHYMQTAADVVNTFSVSTLTKLFWEYGEERYSRKIAQAIVEARRRKKIKTTGRLTEIILSAVAFNRKNKIHPATRVFQALRIFVNKELENINAFLVSAFDSLAVGGRLVCISFHSLEDRLVKEFFQLKESEGTGAVITKKPVTAAEDELGINPSSRSAKLRVIEKK